MSKLDTMDAKLWAQEFMRLFGERRQEIDEGLMLAWFANAIMRGYDEVATRACEWTGGDDAYETACGHAYALPYGTVADHEHRYCPWCGRHIRERAKEESNDGRHTTEAGDAVSRANH